MISGENIQQYINFLHEKRYNTPADEELLERWKSLNDFEIIQQLQGLYNFWGIDNMTADMYERLFFQSHALQTPVVPESDNEHHKEEKKSLPFKYILITLLGLAIIAAAIWLLTRGGNFTETNSDLKKKAQQLQDSVSMEHAIRMQREQEIQRKAAERAAKIKEVKANTSRYVTQKVTYDYDNLFGGIDNVQVTVSNSSDFKMNEVKVQLSYIKKNGELYDTQYITISNIPAHGQKTVSGPESKRGMSMDSKITGIQSDELEQNNYQ